MSNPLGDFQCLVSDDPVKQELELTCTKCYEVLCDVEDGDSLEVLASMASDHRCKSK